MDTDNNDAHRSTGDSPPTPLVTSGGGRRALGALTRVARFRLPLWVTLVVVVAVVVVFSLLLRRSDSVDLGPAVPGARQVYLDLTICNETVDARGINPRQAEKDLQALFEKQQHVADAKVRIERIDCGPSTTTAGK